MTKLKRLLLISAAVSLILSASSCQKAYPGENYLKENAGATGYGASIKSSLYIEDFYFVNTGTSKSSMELILGSPHYREQGNDYFLVYDLNNGDSIEFTFDEEKDTVDAAQYVYADGDKANFFDILVEAGVLKSADSESGQTNVQLPGDDPANDNADNQTDTNQKPPEGQSGQQSTDQKHNVVQGEQFATGTYNYILIEPVLSLGLPRSSIISAVGKPSYYYSHDFSYDSYIIDCYNLNDGSKLYLDYGYARDNLRSASIYKNGSYTILLGSQWLPQVKPNGFTRRSVDKNTVGRLKKNMTPAQVYKTLGEPSWYEGTSASYSDVYVLSNGELAYLNFSTSHNKLTSLSIKGVDGKVTAITLN